jgi:hypothetical protein
MIEFLAKPFRTGTLRVNVRVFPSRRAMLKAAKREGQRLPRTLCGYVESIRIETLTPGGWRLSPICAQINLALGYLDLNTISHECVHAAMVVTRRKYPKRWREQRDRLEEAIAYAQANLLVQILLGLQRRGLLDADRAKVRRLRWAEARVTELAA